MGFKRPNWSPRGAKKKNVKGERRGRGRRRREEEEEEAKQAKVWNFGFFVWKLNLSMDTWFKTLYLVYGLGLGTLNSFLVGLS